MFFKMIGILMEAVALLLAKQKSKRLKDKNFRDFCGKPMYLWNLEKCLRIFEKVYISSDNCDCLTKARTMGAIPIERPKNLINVPNIPCYRHAQKTMKADIIVAVQVNSPTLPEFLIRRAKEIMEEGSFQELMTCHSDYKLYGSIWALTARRLKTYKNFYKQTPEALLVDPNVDIHNLRDFKQAERQMGKYD